MELFANKHYFGKFDPPDNGLYDWDCARYASQLLPQKKICSLAEFIALNDEISILLKKIKNVLDYIILLRQTYTRLRSEKLLDSLVNILNMDLDGCDKAQLVRNQWLDWANWMQAIHPGPDLLRDECCEVGVALMLCLTKGGVL